jgi:hypothetical protein
MSDKEIIEFFESKTKNIQWEIVDRKKVRTMLRGNFKEGAIYVAIVPEYLKNVGYWRLMSRDIARHIGLKLFFVDGDDEE